MPMFGGLWEAVIYIYIFKKKVVHKPLKALDEFSKSPFISGLSALSYVSMGYTKSKWDDRFLKLGIPIGPRNGM